ncbi:MAG: hypothetical protein EBU90_09950 [Proteobacteria bacterium]|nr:hypothetical protein [Pseudomonadota bacterium]
MGQFNDNIQYGRVKFPNESKWTQKAKTDGYRTIIIGDCEWFAEDLIELLDSPVNLNPDQTASTAYNQDESSSKLHQIANNYNPTTSQSNACGPWSKLIPSTQGSGGDTALADTSPIAPAGTLPCYSNGLTGNISITSKSYNYKGVRLLMQNLPKELKQEGWKLPDTKDIINLFKAIHAQVNPNSTNTITDASTSITNLTNQERINIRKALGSTENNLNDSYKLNPGTYITRPTSSNYTNTSNADTNQSGFSAIYTGSAGVCGVHVFGSSLLPDSNTYNNATNDSLRSLYLLRHASAVNYWGSEVAGGTGTTCGYSTTVNGYTTINGCGSNDGFNFGRITGFSLLNISPNNSDPNNSTNTPRINNLSEAPNTAYAAVANISSPSLCNIRLCRRIPFKVKNNRNLGLETVTGIGEPDVTTKQEGYYLISPQGANPAQDCIQNIVFDIKNNFGENRVVEAIYFRETPNSLTPGAETKFEYINGNYKVEKVAINNSTTNITSSTSFATTNIFNSDLSGSTNDAPSFTITMTSSQTLALGESLRITLPANFGISDPVIPRNEFNFYPIVRLHSNDSGWYTAASGTYNDFNAYKVPRNCPVLLNRVVVDSNFIKYGGNLSDQNRDLGYTIQNYSGQNNAPALYRDTGFPHFPTIKLFPISANDFNNWTFPKQYTLTPFYNLTNPVDNDFGTLIYDATPNQEAFVEFRIPNPTVQTLKWVITTTVNGDIEDNINDFTFDWITVAPTSTTTTGDEYNHSPDTIVKLKITWNPTSAYTFNETIVIAPDQCRQVTGNTFYGWEINLTGESIPTGPSVDLLCDGKYTIPNTLNLNVGVAASFTITIPYTNGNGVAFTIPATSSTGVTGLTAAQLTGTLANGNGQFVFTVTGTPSTAGNATFDFNIFGSSCKAIYTVTVPRPNELDKESACATDTVRFTNYSCNIVSNINEVTVGGVATTFTVDPKNCTIDFLVPEGITTIGSTNVVFYNNTAVLESLPLEIIPCGINYFGPDANTGAQGCSTITYNNPDCSIVNNVASIIVDGREVEWGIISSTSTCKLFINLPEIDRPGFVKIEFIGEDGRQFPTEPYKITATCDGREEELPLDLNCLSLLQTDNLTFLDCNNNPVPFEEGAVFTQTGWTISFSTELGVWESRHTYRPYMYMYNSKAMYTLTRINEEDSIWKHTEKATRLSYYNNINVSNIFEIDIIFPGEDRRTATGTSTTKNSNKLFSAFAITSDVFNSDINGDQNLFTIPFNKFYVYNSFQLSGEVDFKYLDNIRRVDGSWVINDFRDMSLYTNNNPGQSLMFLQEGVINSSYINSNKNWYEKRKFVDKWIGIRLILDNSPSNLVYLYNVVFNSRPSFR